MRDLFITLNIMASFPVILMRPYVGITMWCWLSYMNPHRLTWGFAYSLPFALAVALLTIVGTVLSKEPKRLPLNAISVLIVMITIWISITTVFAIVPDQAFAKWDRTIKILAMTFMTMVLVTNRERLQALIWIIVLSLGYYGVKGGIFAIVTAGNYRVWGPPLSFIADNNQLAFPCSWCCRSCAICRSRRKTYGSGAAWGALCCSRVWQSSRPTPAAPCSRRPSWL